VWHNQGVGRDGSTGRERSRERKVPPPLDEARLGELALRYVSRFATTQAKLRDYLRRKLRERGWGGTGEPPVDALVERMVRLCYVDDAAFARAKGGSMTARGLGRGRVTQALRFAGVSDDDGAEAKAAAEESAVESALRFARRRRIGPWASDPVDRKGKEKWIGALLRAGHPLGLARLLAEAAPGEEWTAERLRDEGF
jgi:regulatory protein